MRSCKSSKCWKHRIFFPQVQRNLRGLWLVKTEVICIPRYKTCTYNKICCSTYNNCHIKAINALGFWFRELSESCPRPSRLAVNLESLDGAGYGARLRFHSLSGRPHFFVEVSYFSILSNKDKQSLFRIVDGGVVLDPSVKRTPARIYTKVLHRRGLPVMTYTSFYG